MATSSWRTQGSPMRFAHIKLFPRAISIAIAFMLSSFCNIWKQHTLARSQVVVNREYAHTRFELFCLVYTDQTFVNGISK